MEEQLKQSLAKLSEIEEQQEKVIKLLEERLVKHDENRKVVQGKLTKISNKLTEQIDELEDRINKELCEKFTSEDDKLQAALNELLQSYEIIENKKPNNDITTLYELKIERRTITEDVSVGLPSSKMDSSTNNPSDATEKGGTPYDPYEFANEREHLIELLEERLEKHDCNKKAAQDKIHEILNRLRAQLVELEDRVNKDLEKKFILEDNRFQAAFNDLRGSRAASALQKAKAELLIEQSYEIIENKKPNFDITTLYELKAERRIVPELMEMEKPTNGCVTGVNRGSVSVEFAYLNPDEERVLSDNAIVNPVKYKCLLFKKGNEQESKEYPLYKDKENDSSSFFTFTPDTLEAETSYGIKVKIVVGARESEWSDIAEFITPEFKKCCVWKKCPDDVYDKRKYSVDGGNPRVATKNNGDYYCTIIGNTYIPLNAVTSWSIKILNSKKNNGHGIYIGIAPFDIIQNNYDNYYECGWYFYCWGSTLISGPPHNYVWNKEYGPRKGSGEYLRTGDSVGVVMDTTRGELSFVLDGVNQGVAYEGIPLDKPLVPCVILGNAGDSVELDTSEVKENVDSSISVPSNITLKDTTWDSITLTWNKVTGVSFYQVEVDGSMSCDASTTNSFTKKDFFPETEHSFRVRTVSGSSVSEWSSVVKGRTLKAPEFSECVWKKCPDNVNNKRKYRVSGGNPRVATIISYDDRGYTIIGSTHIPLNKVTSWSVKILKSKKNNGNSIYIGIAPSDINQNDGYNCINCGWYFNCYYSALDSGPPHNYRDKQYGPMKERRGQYVHTGDSVGVLMGTTKGNLSFVLNGANLGVAYKGIPLDKPLVPCVILYFKGDSIELII